MWLMCFILFVQSIYSNRISLFMSNSFNLPIIYDGVLHTIYVGIIYQYPDLTHRWEEKTELSYCSYFSVVLPTLRDVIYLKKNWTDWSELILLLWMSYWFSFSVNCHIKSLLSFAFWLVGGSWNMIYRSSWSIFFHHPRVASEHQQAPRKALQKYLHLWTPLVLSVGNNCVLFHSESSSHEPY